MIKFNLNKGIITIKSDDFDENGIIEFQNISDKTLDNILGHVSMTGGVPAIGILSSGSYVGMPRDVEFAIHGLDLQYKITGKYSKKRTAPIDPEKVY